MKKDNTAVSVVISQKDVEAMYALAENAQVFIDGGADDWFVDEYSRHIRRVDAITKKYVRALENKEKRMTKKVSMLKQVKEVQ